RLRVPANVSDNDRQTPRVSPRKPVSASEWRSARRPAFCDSEREPILRSCRPFSCRRTTRSEARKWREADALTDKVAQCDCDIIAAALVARFKVHHREDLWR